MAQFRGRGGGARGQGSSRGGGGGRGGGRGGGGRGGSRGRGQGRGRGRGRGSSRGRSNYNSSRLEEVQSEPESDAESLSAAEPEISEVEEEEDVSSDEEPEARSVSYATLLQSLNTRPHVAEPARKKRKLDGALNHAPATETSREQVDIEPRMNLSNGDGPVDSAEEEDRDVDDASDEEGEEEEGEDGNGEVEDDEEDEEEDNDAEEAEEDEDDKEDTTDPFEKHINGPDLTAKVKAAQEKKRRTTFSKITGNIRKTSIEVESLEKDVATVTPSAKPTHLKSRLQRTGLSAWSQLEEPEKDFGANVLAYRDVVYADRSTHNVANIRNIVCLQTLNHVLKTRDRVLKNNFKLSKDTSGDLPDLRDQGFTRPKVLFILPTKNSCVRMIETLVALSEPEQQENKAKFTDNFANPDESKEWGDDRPEDFRELFSGNDDDMFRIGLKFTRKTLKYFSQFYTSDIILASPLGLRTAIENAGKDKTHDADFLSSIEIAIVDHADALLMQNWQHVEYIFSQLNLLPKDPHGCDFTRVRTFYLDNLSRHFRQTIILSSFLTPEINSLATNNLHNHSGLTKYVPTYPGAMLNLPSTLPASTTQTFLRFKSPTPSSDPSLRFNYFTTSLLPPLLPSSRSKGQSGTLIFVPSYFSFLRLQTYLSTDQSCTSLSFSSINEYSSHRDVARTRSHFANGRYSLLLYTERAHHFRRFQSIRGVKRIIFFGVPENHLFWSEICGYLGDSSGEEGKRESGKGKIKALFSKWDVLKMERIVGTERVGKMIKGDEGDVFEFV